MPANHETDLRTFPEAKRKRKYSGTVFFIVGAAAIAAATVLWVYNVFDNRRASEASQQTAQTILEIIRANDAVNAETGSNSAEEPGTGDPNVVFTIPGDIVEETPFIVVGEEAYMGILSIPRFSLDLPVNVAWSYPKLKASPCRYSGDVEKNDLVVAAHSYRSHFGNINSLASGDEIIFTDAMGRVYNYYVAAVGTAKPSETRSVVSSQYHLTLFTCTYDSRARVVVRCYLSDGR